MEAIVVGIIVIAALVLVGRRIARALGFGGATQKAQGAGCCGCSGASGCHGGTRVADHPEGCR